MNNFLKSSDSDLFLNLSLPTGIDKNAVVDDILLRGGEFEVLYADPYFLRDSLVTWSKKWYWTFNRWLNAINIEYNPLENYDRMEEGTETGTDEGSISSNNTNVRTDNLIETQASTDNVTTENTVSAFDSSTYSPHDKTHTLNENTYATHNEGQQTVTNENTGTSEVNTSKQHNLHIHGNIGVTTSQQMLQSEIDIAMFNLYDKIADVFLQEYVIPIY